MQKGFDIDYTQLEDVILYKKELDIEYTQLEEVLLYKKGLDKNQK